MPFYRLATIALLVLAALQARADETAFYSVSPSELKIVEGEWPPQIFSGAYWDNWSGWVTLDGEGEAYVLTGDDLRQLRNRAPARQDADSAARPGEADFQNGAQGPRLVVSIPEPRDVSGWLIVPQPGSDEFTRLRFRLPADKSQSNAKRDFLYGKLVHYESLLQDDIVGAAWFRHQARTTRKALGLSTDIDRRRNWRRNWRRRRFFGISSNSELEDTYALFSGGRAVSENLQLDRLLPQSAPGKLEVALDSLRGITIKEFDWASYVEGIDPELDPLAALVPFDQHAVFFPSFEALARVIDNGELLGTPALRAAEPRGEDVRSRERYELQLGLKLDAAARFAGGKLISSVALTGGDPYFRTGTDIALLFETDQPAALKELLVALVKQRGQDYPGAEVVQGEAAGVSYEGIRSPDRVVCSYVASMAGTIVVTNSRVQLERLAEVAGDEIQSLAKLDEYRFFRDRYARDPQEETALVIITDATIRRWCGPRWRIATARRTQAMALMADQQAAHLDQLVNDEDLTGTVGIDRWLPGADNWSLSRAGVQSAEYGTLQFATPISELHFERVTKQEASFYERWRDGYERNWSNFFDPIAIRIHIDDKHLSADTTVMPLIDSTVYRDMQKVSQDARLGPTDGDPHDALAQIALAIDPESDWFKKQGNTVGFFLPNLKIEPLSWVGNSVTLYTDKTSFWNEAAQADDPEQFVRDNPHRLPIGLNVGVRNGFKLTAFLAGVRAFIEGSAPGMTDWEIKEHAERKYVRISLSEQGRGGVPDDFQDVALVYAATGKLLIVSLSEEMLRAAIEREQQRSESKEQADERSEVQASEQATHVEQGWLGGSAALNVDRQFIELTRKISAERTQRMLQERAWRHISILNEWHARFPDREPTELHADIWHVWLTDPAGGGYRWNEQWQTMESTHYGHPAAPQQGPIFDNALAAFASARLGVTFEEHGLRGRAELERVQ